MARLARWTDWLLALGLSLLAFALRLPYLYLIPRYVDEGLEVVWGLDIAQGHHLPLTGFDPYYGPFYYYLLAALVKLIGVNPWLPRLLSAVFGALVAGAAFWLARSMGNRWSGILTGALVATNSALIVWSSHYAWSNSLTPFFATATFAAFYLGVRKRSDHWLVASGLLAALMLQTHPLTVVAIFGMVLWFLFQRSQWQRFRTPAPYLAVVAFLIGYAPVLIATLTNSRALLNAAAGRNYAFAPTASPIVYLQRLGALLIRLALGSGDYLTGATPYLWVLIPLFTALIVAGLLWTARRGNAFPLTVIGTSVLLLPVFLDGYNESLSRYITFLLPLGYAAGAVFVVQAITELRIAPTRRVGRILVGGAAVLALVLLCGLTLAGHYRMLVARNETNADYLSLRDTLRKEGACGNNLYVERLTPESYHKSYLPFESFVGITLTLALDQCAYHAANGDLLVTDLAKRGATGWLLAPKSSVAEYEQRFTLQPIPLDHPNYSVLAPYGLYRVEPKTALKEEEPSK